DLFAVSGLAFHLGTWVNHRRRDRRRFHFGGLAWSDRRANPRDRWENSALRGVVDWSSLRLRQVRLDQRDAFNRPVYRGGFRWSGWSCGWFFCSDRGKGRLRHRWFWGLEFDRCLIVRRGGLRDCRRSFL